MSRRSVSVEAALHVAAALVEGEPGEGGLSQVRSDANAGPLSFGRKQLPLLRVEPDRRLMKGDAQTLHVNPSGRGRRAAGTHRDARAATVSDRCLSDVL